MTFTPTRPGHIAFDFDGVLAHDGFHEIGGTDHFSFVPDAEVDGEPIWPMLNLLNEFRAAGYECRILTARTVYEPVHAWLIKHLGFDLEVSNIKAKGMLLFFDDRAVRVERNTGEVVGPVHCHGYENPLVVVGNARAAELVETAASCAPRQTLAFYGEFPNLREAHDRDERNHAVPYDKWIPEAPDYGGVYGVTPKNGVTCTHDVHSALQFDTKEACQAWCTAFPYPRFEPRCHGFG